MAIHNQVVLNGQVQDFKRIVRSDPKEKESKKSCTDQYTVIGNETSTDSGWK